MGPEQGEWQVGKMGLLALSLPVAGFLLPFWVLFCHPIELREAQGSLERQGEREGGVGGEHTGPQVTAALPTGAGVRGPVVRVQPPGPPEPGACGLVGVLTWACSVF